MYRRQTGGFGRSSFFFRYSKPDLEVTIPVNNCPLSAPRRPAPARSPMTAPRPSPSSRMRRLCQFPRLPTLSTFNCPTFQRHMHICWSFWVRVTLTGMVTGVLVAQLSCAGPSPRPAPRWHLQAQTPPTPSPTAAPHLCSNL